MDYEEIQKKRKLLEQKKEAIPPDVLAQTEVEFEAKFTFDSLALSGSSLSLDDVKAIFTRTEKKES